MGLLTEWASPMVRDPKHRKLETFVFPTHPSMQRFQRSNICVNSIVSFMYRWEANPIFVVTNFIPIYLVPHCSEHQDPPRFCHTDLLFLDYILFFTYSRLNIFLVYSIDYLFFSLSIKNIGIFAALMSSLPSLLNWRFILFLHLHSCLVESWWRSIAM